VALGPPANILRFEIRATCHRLTNIVEDAESDSRYDRPMVLPVVVQRLFWDVDPATIDIEHHRSYVMERVMTRGTWVAMQWLLATYAIEAIRAFVEEAQSTLPPNVLAFWALVSDAKVTVRAGGGRPAWAA
jgi:hypothetical protein